MCQIEANRVWCEANLEGDTQNVIATMSQERKTQLSEQLEQVCPTSWKMPFGGPYVVMVQELEKRGGPSFFEKWLSASNMLHDSLHRRYPLCRKEREKLGLFGSSEECLEAWYKNIRD
jgi:hypothetical protein